MIQTDIIIENEAWHRVDGLDALVDRAFQAASRVEPAEGVIAVMLADDALLHRLNHQFRGKDKTTDILSFPADAMDRPMLGDVAVAFETAARDADTGGKTMGDHLTHLLIHGYLHLLGHDHEKDAEAEKMESLEIKALASLGIANPYSDN